MKKGLILTVITLSHALSYATERYVPYPVVFIHGLGSSAGTWNVTRNQISKYYENLYGYKLTNNPFSPNVYNDNSALWFADYSIVTTTNTKGNNGDISNIAWDQDTQDRPTVRFIFGKALDAMSYAKFGSTNTYNSLDPVRKSQIKVNFVCNFTVSRWPQKIC